MGVPAAIRPMTGSSTDAASTPMAAGGPLGAAAVDDRGLEAGARLERLGQPRDLDGARAVRQPADEAALLERGDQAMDAGLRPQVERVLHLVEGRRHPILLQSLVDEVQEVVLLARKHVVPWPVPRYVLDTFLFCVKNQSVDTT